MEKHCFLSSLLLVNTILRMSAFYIPLKDGNDFALAPSPLFNYI